MFIKITSTFLVGSLLVLLIFVKQDFSGQKKNQQLVNFWKQQVARIQLDMALQKNEHEIFQQEVALLIPQKNLQGPNTGAVRSLASVIPREKSPLTIEMSPRELLRQGKQKVVERDFKRGLSLLDRLITSYPSSLYQVEARYLTIEANFNQGHHSEVVSDVEKMVELFPENRLTGYALLRLGGVFESQDRLEEALKIYRTILYAFPKDKVLTDLADQQVNLLEL